MGRVEESVAIRFLAAGERDTAIAGLKDPWVADEGPLTAHFGRKPTERALGPRGLAFDAEATVVWDEDGVEVLSAQSPQSGVVAWESPVLVCDRFVLLKSLRRIDYFQAGTLLGSRYRVARGGER